MATTRKNLATSLQLGFITGTDDKGENIVTQKSFTRMNPEASDEALQAAGKELMALYANKNTADITRVDTYALEAA